MSFFKLADMKNPFTILSLFICFLFALTSLSWDRYPTMQTVFQEDNPKQNLPASTYSVKIIPAPEKTFGYEIYLGTKLLIRQENIPGVSGIKGFRRKADAEKVAKLVTAKLEKGIMPPTVEKAEMEKLKVQF
jgi:hypothetical protein